MTAESCRVAIRRRPPPPWGHASTSMPKGRCMRADEVQAGGVDFTPASLGQHAPVGDHGNDPFGGGHETQPSPQHSLLRCGLAGQAEGPEV
jgi:hypothetical protein